VLAAPGFFHPTSIVDARVTVLPGAQHVLKDGAPIRFHVGTSEVMGYTALLDSKRIEPGESALVQFRLEEPVVVDARDRFVVRLQSPTITVGGGVVIRDQDRKLKRFRSHILEDLEAQEKAIASDEGALEFTLRKSGKKPVKPRDLAKSTRLPAPVVEKGLKALEARNSLVALPGDSGFLHRASFDEAGEEVATLLQRFHDENPLRAGMARTSLRSAAGLERTVFDVLVAEGIASGRLVALEDVVGLRDRQPDLDDAKMAERTKVEDLFRESAFSPPSVVLAAERVGLREEAVRALIGMLTDQGRLVEVAEGMFFHREVLQQAQDTLVSHLKAHEEIGAVTFRDLVGASRKFVYPILDYFDLKGVTVRRGNLRYLKGER
jgi:selenocysteine-specific elongation factor